MIKTCGNPPVVSLSGVDKMLDAAKRGECLGISDLLEIESALTAISRMKSYLYRGRSFNIPLAYYDENIATDASDVFGHFRLSDIIFCNDRYYIYCKKPNNVL